MLNAAVCLDDLRVPPGNRLEKLQGRYAAFHSIRINAQYRIVFRWKEVEGAGEALDVTIVDDH